MGSNMKLTYWVAICTNDPHESNHLRGKTKKAVLAEIDLHKAGNSWHEFEAPRKVEVHFDDSFDLLHQCLSERGYWE